LGAEVYLIGQMGTDSQSKLVKSGTTSPTLTQFIL